MLYWHGSFKSRTRARVGQPYTCARYNIYILFSYPDHSCLFQNRIVHCGQCHRGIPIPQPTIPNIAQGGCVRYTDLTIILLITPVVLEILQPFLAVQDQQTNIML